MLKLNLISIFVLFNIVQSGLSQLKWRSPYNDGLFEHFDHDPKYEALYSNEIDEDVDEHSAHAHSDQEVTPVDPDLNDASTTEKTIDPSTPPEIVVSTTARPGAKSCPKGQSSFTIDDLIVMIDHVAETELNIMVSINDSYHDTAIQTRDMLFQIFNDYKNKFMERPEHLNHVLDDLDNSLQNIVEPLVRTANTSLQELPVIDRTYNRLNIRTTRILKDLENYKNICKWNCKQQYRSYFAPSQFSPHEDFSPRIQPIIDTLIEINEVKGLKPDGYFCSTIENVYKTIHDRLMAFEQEEKESILKKIIDDENILKEMIELLKNKLKDTAVNEFGTSMYDILSLFDDYFHSVEDLKDFNDQSFITDIKKANINAELNFVELEVKIKGYKERCLKCSLALQRRTIAGFIEKEEDGAPTETKPDKNDVGVLDQLIDNKIEEIRKTVHANIESIFKELNDIVNDQELVQKTIDSLKPIQESVKLRVQRQGERLRKLMDTVPEESIEKVKKLRHDSQSLLKKISNTLAALEKLT